MTLIVQGSNMGGLGSQEKVKNNRFLINKISRFFSRENFEENKWELAVAVAVAVTCSH